MPRRNNRTTTEIFQTELNLIRASRTVAGRRYIAVRKYSLRKCNENNVLSRKQAGDTLWNQISTEVVGHAALQGFQDKFNSPWNGPYRAFHISLDVLIMDLLKKASEARRNARLNPDADEEVEAEDDAGGLRDERAIARPQPTVYQEKPIRMIMIKASDAEPGQARQLPWVVRGPATPSTNWLAVLKHYTLQELGEAAYRYCEKGEHPRQFIGILRDIQGQNVTPNAPEQIKLINDDQVNS